MTLQLAAAYILNLIVNSLLGFVALLAIVRLILLIGRPRSARARLWLHALPMIKLAIDPFLYRFDRWALAQGINPLDAPAGTRTLGIWAGQNGVSFCGIGLSLEGGETFSLADILVLSIPAPAIMAIVGLFLAVSLLQVSKVIRRIAAARAYAESATAPLCYGWLWPVWRVPSSSLSGLSDAQAQAIVCHEQQHARWRDPLLLAVLEAVAALYWWLPLRGCVARIRLEQENDCDRAALGHCSGPDYAAALVAVGRSQVYAYCTEAQHALGQRIDSILAGPAKAPRPLPSFIWFLVGWIFLGARFWMF